MKKALKVPHFELGSEPSVRERFLREAWVAASLDHPNLCPIFDAGVIEGIYFLTMRFSPGKPLSESTGRPHPPHPPGEAIKIVVKLAEALEYAHANGVIHRDLKPSNVMMCPATGPTVMDFGLAKQTRQQDQKLTQIGITMGTPAYMPPEQVKGDLDLIGPASDVYSLGVILFELLTGRLPFEGSTAEILGKALFTAAPLPSRFLPELNRAMDAVCGKAMAKALEVRYPSMKTFAAALLEAQQTLVTKDRAGSSPFGKEYTNDIGMKWVSIPGGTCTMGSPKEEVGRYNIENEHPVEISSFHLGIHEVTQKQFRAVMGYNPSYFSTNATGKNGIDYRTWKPGGGKDRIPPGEDTEDYPVENVSWEEAKEFCDKLTALDTKKPAGWAYRLPTEAEWEYACRGGASSHRVFHVGDSLSSSQANFDGNYPYGGADKGEHRGRTCKVGSYEKNRFGLYDMHGNVWEWCHDWFAADYYDQSPPVDPPGPEQGTQRVIRGGSWDDDGRYCRSAYRDWYEPTIRYFNLGFRVALVPFFADKSRCDAAIS